MSQQSAQKLKENTARIPQVRGELLQASDQFIEDAVKFGDPLTLRGLIYQLTGDEALAEIELASVRFFFADAWAPARPEDVALIHSKAADYLKLYRDQGAGEVGIGPMERLPRSLELAAGEPIAAGEMDMWIEETGLDPWARSLRWQRPPPVERLQAFKVAVIGCGLGGIAAAVQLRHAGIPYVVLEKNSGVGGTWFENRYPGARVDTPSRAYTHIFGAEFVFGSPFSPQADNEKYFNWATDRHGIRGDIHFNTEVESLTWDEATKVWRIVARGPDGARRYEANAVICATGLLARPNVPVIEGMNDFKGPIFHTARWPSDLEVSGKRVAVVGTGATGYQLVPELAKVAQHVHLIQRKPQWVFPLPGYLHPLPPEVTWLDRNLPFHINFMRFRTNWLTGEKVYTPIFTADLEWRDPHSRSALNHSIRNERIAYLSEKFKDRPDLAANMIPPHPPFSARPILVDANYNIYDALLRDNVTLVAGGIQRLTHDGLVVDGRHYPADIIVLATGFRANDLLAPMQIRGRGGLKVEQRWAKDGARAYVSGSMMPGFPNLFMLYGPNTNPSAGGGIVNTEEMVTRFALECIEKLILEGKHAIDVTEEAFSRYNEELDQREAQKIYTDPRAQNFYMNQYARSSVMLPFSPSELWNKLRPLKLGDFKID
jgi:4-hydroxyacetophenone monooxygenase